MRQPTTAPTHTPPPTLDPAWCAPPETPSATHTEADPFYSAHSSESSDNDGSSHPPAPAHPVSLPPPSAPASSPAPSNSPPHRKADASASPRDDCPSNKE